MCPHEMITNSSSVICDVICDHDPAFPPEAGSACIQETTKGQVAAMDYGLHSTCASVCNISVVSITQYSILVSWLVVNI